MSGSVYPAEPGRFPCGIRQCRQIVGSGLSAALSASRGGRWSAEDKPEGASGRQRPASAGWVPASPAVTGAQPFAAQPLFAGQKKISNPSGLEIRGDMKKVRIT